MRNITEISVYHDQKTPMSFALIIPLTQNGNVSVAIRKAKAYTIIDDGTEIIVN